MPGETIDVVTRAAALLREAAETLRTAAAGNSAVAEQWLERALAYEHTSDALRQLPAAPRERRDGIWHLREGWRGADDPPPWPEVAFDAADPTHVTWKDAVYAAIAQQRGATLPSTAVQISFGRPAFFHSRVILARLRRESWSAIFSIVADAQGYRARNFDFASPEVHRLNAVTPLNCIGRELAYFRYFMYVVRGDEGPFRLLEGDALAQAAPHIQTFEEGTAVLEQIHPPTFDRVALDGGLIYRVWIAYAGTVFRCTMSFYLDGRVSMLDDDSHLSVPALAG